MTTISVLRPMLAALLTTIGGCGHEATSDSESSPARGEIAYGIAELSGAPQFRVDPVPMAVSDGGSTAFDLTYAHDVVLLSDNRIVTYGTPGAALFLFDPQARGLRRLGREGQGPGEFADPAHATGIRGDTVVLLDTPNDRISWVTADAVPARSRRIGSDLPRLMYRVAGALPDGRLVLSDAGFSSSARASRDTIKVGIMPTEGPVTIIAVLPGQEYVAMETRYGGRRRTVLVRPNFSGIPQVAVWNDVIAVSLGGPNRIELFDATGNPAGAIVVRRARRPVTTAMRDSLLSRQLGSRGTHTGEAGGRLIDPAETARRFRETPSADSLPAFTALFPASDGVLWALEGAAFGDSVWTAIGFRRDGSIAGRLSGPLSASPSAIGHDRIVVLHRDVDGVVSLRVHRLQRR